MSKSLGNLVFVSDLRTEIDPRAIRLALMAHHYRSDFEWFDDEGPKAQTDLDLLIEACAIAEPLSEGQLMDEVREALDDDLNAPQRGNFYSNQRKSSSTTHLKDMKVALPPPPHCAESKFDSHVFP